MATHTSASVIATSRTPESVVIHVQNDGGADDPTYTMDQATLLGQLREGPLKAILTKTADWSVFNAPSGPLPIDDRLRLTAIEGGLNLTWVPPGTSLILRFVAAGIEFSITEFDADEYQECHLLVELRIMHSNER